jgi:hypothetical protein
MNYAQKLIDAARVKQHKEEHIRRLRQIRSRMPAGWWEKEGRRLELKLLYGADYEEDEAS